MTGACDLETHCPLELLGNHADLFKSQAVTRFRQLLAVRSPVRFSHARWLSALNIARQLNRISETGGRDSRAVNRSLCQRFPIKISDTKLLVIEIGQSREQRSLGITRRSSESGVDAGRARRSERRAPRQQVLIFNSENQRNVFLPSGPCGQSPT